MNNDKMKAPEKKNAFLYGGSVIVIIVGVALSLLLFHTGKLDHRELIIALFKEQAEERSQAIKSVIENNLLILRSVAAFY